MPKFSSCAAAVVLLCGTLAAESALAAALTTTFSSDNARRGNFFDIDVVNALTITGFDINLSTALTKEVFVYYRSGTWDGFEGSSVGWTLAGSQVVTSAGSNVPTFVDIPDFTLGAGITGLFVTTDGSTPSAILYTNGTTTFSNADLSILAGAGTAVPFDGSIIRDRIWNGTIHYDLVQSVPEPNTLALGLLVLGLMAPLTRRAKS